MFVVIASLCCLFVDCLLLIGVLLSFRLFIVAGCAYVVICVACVGVVLVGFMFDVVCCVVLCVLCCCERVCVCCCVLFVMWVALCCLCCNADDRLFVSLALLLIRWCVLSFIVSCVFVMRLCSLLGCCDFDAFAVCLFVC